MEIVIYQHNSPCTGSRLIIVDEKLYFMKSKCFRLLIGVEQINQDVDFQRISFHTPPQFIKLYQPMIL